ncbi:Outer membrane lipoprotein carrier protein LolA [Shewanella psychrophila]|uniref:Outer membrane lipoprotein carrier protein LolA n=1 Tax=Shewanella psychrophila TaxID=225848 RepID=A0A1S6HSL0_9GAMM|nr:outer membrane lipoprotein carrier protein LolA [Shewanella psychrophila]AQS38474.1 Outer membrane lipoprotein carrier protein LolA [Shewanella psychrophila]
MIGAYSRISGGLTLALLLLSAVLLTLISSRPTLANTDEIGVNSAQKANFEALFQSEVNNQEIEKLSNRLELSQHAKGKFTQYRNLKVLKKPLISNGSFIFDAQLGLVWSQETPFKSTLILKDDALIQIDSSGKKQVSQTSGNQGAGALAQTLPTLLKALLGGKLQTLDEHFSFYLLAPEPQASWTLGLIPKDSLMLKAIPQLILEGTDQVSALTLVSANGDTSRIEFEEITNDPLASEELDILAPNLIQKQGKASQGLTEPELKPKQAS